MCFILAVQLQLNGWHVFYTGGTTSADCVAYVAFWLTSAFCVALHVSFHITLPCLHFTTQHVEFSITSAVGSKQQHPDPPSWIICRQALPGDLSWPGRAAISTGQASRQLPRDGFASVRPPRTDGPSPRPDKATGWRGLYAAD